jgi:1-acyl-sn-glycerol-3-phosphate acyltransferase
VFTLAANPGSRGRVGGVSILDSLVAVGQTLRISVGTVVDSALGRADLARSDERLESWSAKVVAKAQIDLRVRGAAVDYSRPYVIMSNHQSHLDVPVLYRVVQGRLRMITKKELFQIPVFGKALRSAGFVEVDRSDRQAAIASLRAAEGLLKGGTHIWIAPEGTRTRDGRVGKLKKGGFLMAKATGLPILPIAINGTRAALPKGGMSIQRGCVVEVFVGEPFGVEGQEVAALMQRIETFFAEHVRPA